MQFVAIIDYPLILSFILHATFKVPRRAFCAKGRPSSTVSINRKRWKFQRPTIIDSISTFLLVHSIYLFIFQSRAEPRQIALDCQGKGVKSETVLRPNAYTASLFPVAVPLRQAATQNSISSFHPATF